MKVSIKKGEQGKGRNAAVILTVPPKKENMLSYAEVKAARFNVDLKDLKIEHLHIKREITGSLILEVPDQERAEGGSVA